ncbi:transposase, partial [Rhodovulum sulfidophilum]|nr:transposase [Rhodovulum sulfidophilum]
YRTINWSEYDASLRRLGSLSVWFDPDMNWYARKVGKRGHPETFSESAFRF